MISKKNYILHFNKCLFFLNCGQDIKVKSTYSKSIVIQEEKKPSYGSKLIKLCVSRNKRKCKRSSHKHVVEEG